MKYIARDMSETVQEASADYACVIVTGPRQVGKTTMLKKIAENSRHYVTLDDFNERYLAKHDPKMFLNLHPIPILIDEIQYAPELFAYIKIAVDNGAPPGSFWLTGSQAFTLMRLAGETLAGRVAVLHLTSLSQHEMFGDGESLNQFTTNVVELKNRITKYQRTDTIGLYKRIFDGALPGHISGKFANRGLFYASYLETYISRDIRDLVPDIHQEKFLLFLHAIAVRTGSIINAHSIASDIGTSDSTIARWLLLLEKSDVIYHLYPYSNNALKRTIKAPKLYFFDTGLVAYLARYNSPEILESGALSGAIFENYAINELRKNYLNRGFYPPFFYYHDRDNREIDLIIEENNEIIALEVKKTATPAKTLSKVFDLVKKPGICIKKSGIICMSDTLSAFDQDTLIIPIWAL